MCSDECNLVRRAHVQMILCVCVLCLTHRHASGLLPVKKWVIIRGFYSAQVLQSISQISLKYRQSEGLIGSRFKSFIRHISSSTRNCLQGTENGSKLQPDRTVDGNKPRCQR